MVLLYLAFVAAVVLCWVQLRKNQGKRKSFSEGFVEEQGTVTCPRCMGKGNVDEQDIKRLKRELDWMPGSCAYCKGTGLTTEQMVREFAADEVYLTTNLDKAARMRFLNHDQEEQRRAADLAFNIKELKRRILLLHRRKRLSPAEIAEHLLKGETMSIEEWNVNSFDSHTDATLLKETISAEELEEFTRWVSKVIEASEEG